MSFCPKTLGSLVQFRSFSDAILFRFLNCIAKFQCWGSNSGRWQTHYHPPPHHLALWCNFRNTERRLPVISFCFQCIRQQGGGWPSTSLSFSFQLLSHPVGSEGSRQWRERGDTEEGKAESLKTHLSAPSFISTPSNNSVHKKASGVAFSAEFNAFSTCRFLFDCFRFLLFVCIYAIIYNKPQCKNEDAKSNRFCHLKLKDWVGPLSDPTGWPRSWKAATWEAEARGWQVQGQPHQLSEALSQNKKWKGWASPWECTCLTCAGIWVCSSVLRNTNQIKLGTCMNHSLLRNKLKKITAKKDLAAKQDTKVGCTI